MATVNCPHCGEMNVDAGQFCASCGKALPSVDAAGPQVVTGNMVAQTDAGRTVQVEQLAAQAKKAFGVLLFVGIANIVLGVGFHFLLKGLSREAARQHNQAAAQQLAQASGVILVTLLILGVIYVFLAIWSRSDPLPAAIIGLVIYVSLQIVGIVQNPVMYANPIAIIIPIVIIIALVKAIQAGVKHKQLKEQMTVGY